MHRSTTTRWRRWRRSCAPPCWHIDSPRPPPRERHQAFGARMRDPMIQAPPPTTPYGPPLPIDAARKAMAAAEAEATRNNWGVSIAIVDSGGNLLMLHRLDNA